MEFVGLNIAMGVTDLPEYRDYWSEDPILHDTSESSLMARRPNEKLGQYFHCSVAGEELAGDKLAKVRPLIDVCNRNFKGGLAPGQKLSIDEAMIRFDDRLSWKQ